MAKTEWFHDFVGRHIDRNPRADWPPVGSEHWALLRREFTRMGVREDVAEAASNAMAITGLDFISNHIPSLLANIRIIWASSEVPGEAPADKDAAILASRGCIDCGGVTGLTVRYRHKSLVPGADRTITLYCDCPIGRWAERNHRIKSPDVRSRMHDLCDPKLEFLQLDWCEWSDRRDNPWRWPPECWDHANNRPLPGHDKLSGYIIPKTFTKKADLVG